MNININNNNKIKKVLIANRGEIAVRIAKTLKEMGIKSVSVYSDPDINAVHKNYTDESYHIKGVTSSETYIKISELLNAIEKHECDSVHPGYGFLSEKEEFPEALEKHNIRFIGPPKNAIGLLGNKINSKILAESAGVNTIPGLNISIEDPNKALQEALKIGFPVMIKAACGGGGKGMRVVFEEEKFNDAFNDVMSESIVNYNDKNIFIEKYIENPRHIEIQIVGDKYGNYVSLLERECSIQRRNQKIIEEAPSPFLVSLGKKGEEIRKEMIRQSINLVKKINYYSVGTVEFVVDESGNFYFLEVNTRIQVEHTITEEAVRIKTSNGDKKIDIVKLMLDIENSEKLNFKQDDVFFKFHSIEARIYAENPEKNFLPSTGKIEKFHLPDESEKIRVDFGVRVGSEVTSYFDPMIGKICGTGKDRLDALLSLQSGISELVILGSSIHTNILFLESILRNENFLKSKFSTDFIKNEYNGQFNHLIDPLNINLIDIFQRILIINIILCFENLQFISAHGFGFLPYIKANFYITFLFNEKRFAFKINISDDLKYRYISINDNELGFLSLTLSNKNNLLKIKALKTHNTIKDFRINNSSNNNIYEDITVRYITHDYNKYYIEYCGFSFQSEVYSEREFEEYKKIIEKRDEISRNLTKQNKLILKSPLPGIITDIFVNQDDIIDFSSRIMSIESMKMQNIITSELENSKIKKIFVKKGDIVKTGDNLIEFFE